MEKNILFSKHFLGGSDMLQALPVAGITVTGRYLLMILFWKPKKCSIFRVYSPYSNKPLIMLGGATGGLAQIVMSAMDGRTCPPGMCKVRVF